MWAGLLENDPIENGGKVHWGVYLLPVIFGAGTSTILVQSLSITAALIGENTNTAAFVYGAMSLTGKDFRILYKKNLRKSQEKLDIDKKMTQCYFLIDRFLIDQNLIIKQDGITVFNQ